MFIKILVILVSAAVGGEQDYLRPLINCFLGINFVSSIAL
jgi:hypothetical protein